MIYIEQGKYKFEIPSIQDEISIEHGAKFCVLSKKLQTPDLDKVEKVTLLQDAVSVFAKRCDVIPIGELNHLFLPDSIELNRSRVTLVNVFNHIADVINSVEVVSLPIKAQGSEYHLCGIANYKFEDPGTLTAGETIELLHMEKQFGDWINAEKIEDIESLTNIEIGLNANIMAVLLRKEDEPFPINPIEQATFVADRAAIFQNLSWKYAAAISFFLRNLYVAYLMTTSIKDSLQVESSTN